MPEVQLRELAVEEFGPIRRASLVFGPGLNVLTGETGAGKTLLVGALELCLGLPDTRGLRESGRPRAVALVLAGDRECALLRESDGTGRWRALIDGLPTSAAALRELGTTWISIFGQHDSQRLRARGEGVRIVDAFGRIDDAELRVVRARRRELSALLAELGGDSDAQRRELDYLTFQLREFDAVNPRSPAELTETLDRLRRLTALRDHRDETRAALEALDGDGGDTALGRWSAAVRRLPADDVTGPWRAQLEGLAAEARDVLREIAAALDGADVDAAELESLEERVGALHALARKYGGSLEAAIAEREKLAARANALDGAGERAADLEAEDGRLADHERALAAAVRSARVEAAEALGAAVTKNLARVALPRATLEVVVEGDDGSDVELRFSPDGVRPAGPLTSLASGGELSRVLLALSLEVVGEDEVAVFDEIDAGVGGEVAQQIGDCLHELSRRQQVLVVTHLASVAARADHHFVVEKFTGDPHEVATVRTVQGDERVLEIARMLAGDAAPDAARALAEQLLASGVRGR